MKVLVVEDSMIMQQALARLLSSVPDLDIVGYAEDSKSASSMVEERRPDLIVLDVELRAHDRGIDVLHQVVRRHPRIKVMVLSNFGWQAMRTAFMDAGAHAYFDKAQEFRQARDWVAALASSAPQASGGAERAAPGSESA